MKGQVWMSYYDGPGPASDPWASAAPDAYEQTVPVPPPASKGSTALVAVLVSVLVLVLCGGGVTALYLIGAKDRSSSAGGPAAPAGSATGTAGPSRNASPAYDPSTIIKGQCVANDGTNDEPVLRVVACGPGTYQVLAKFDGTIDTTRCKAVPGSNFHYFYDTSPDSLDFVLCLKAQAK